MEWHDGAVTLLPAKKQKTTHVYSNCIICKTSITDDEEWTLPGKQGLDTLSKVAEKRRDDVYYSLQSDTLVLSQVVWHRSCYRSYASRTNVQTAEQNIEHVSNVQQNPLSQTRLSSGHAAKFDPNVCVICLHGRKKKGRGTDSQLCQVVSQSGAQTIHQAASKKQDDVFLRVNGIDLVAAQAKYHNSCRSSYIRIQDGNACDTSMHGSTQSEPDQTGWETPLNSFFKEVDCKLMNQSVTLELSTLRQRYNELMERNDLQPCCSNRKLKYMLCEHYGEEIVFQKQSNPAHSQLVYSSRISQGDIVEKLKELDESLNDSVLDNSFNSEEENVRNFDSEEDQMKVLLEAASILKSEMECTKGLENWPPSTEDLTEMSAENTVGSKLKTFLRWLLIGTNEDTVPTTEGLNNLDDGMRRRILSIGQDILFTSSNGRKMMPKHIALATATYHLVWNKCLITMMNHFGHCVSYDQILRMTTAVANQMEGDPKEITIPDSMKYNTFTQIAADNNDILEETLDGKNTTHCTNMILIQREEGGQIRGQFGNHSSTTKRDRSLKLRSSHALISISRPAARTNPKDPAFKLSGVRDLSHFHSSKEMDVGWLLCRHIPQKWITLEDSDAPQCVPAWTSFNAAASPSRPKRSIIGYCPVINASPTNYNVVYTILDVACRMTKKIGQKHTILVLDQAIYCKAVEISLDKAGDFPDLILRMGGFHILTAFLAVIGKRMENSGIEDVLIESGVFAEGSVAGIMSGKAYNRAVRAHKLMSEALYRLLHEASDIDKLVEKDGRLGILLTEVHMEFENSRANDLPESISQLCGHLDGFIEWQDKIREMGSKESPMFNFWNEYLAMMDILLGFICAERMGDWQLHKASLAAMLPYFFAYDRHNYARYATLNLTQMEALPRTASEVNAHFEEGEFVVARSSRKFAQVSVDLALEQTLNRDTKTSGGIIGFSQNQGAVHRWMQTMHFRASMLVQAKDMAGVDSALSDVHKEQGSSRLQRDETDVQHVMREMKENVNPFIIDETPLSNIKSGYVASPETQHDLQTAYSQGQQALSEFVETRINTGNGFFNPIKQKQLRTFAAVKKKKATSDSSAATSDRDLFSRIVVIAQARQFDLRQLFTYELTSIPLSIATTDGTLRKTDKSVLLHALEGKTVAQAQTSGNRNKTCTILDLMAVIQSASSLASNSPTFGEYANQLFSHIVGKAKDAKRIDVVCDRYDFQFSVKEQERVRRCEGASPLKLHIHGPETTLPKQWKRFLADKGNKLALAQFLLTRWLGMGRSLGPLQTMYIAGCSQADGLICHVLHPDGSHEEVQDLACSHEEADTRMIVHASHAFSQGIQNVEIHSPDTDVLVLSVSFAQYFPGPLTFCTGVGDKKRAIDAKSIASELGPDITRNLIGMHALTGCDTVSGFYGIGKLTAMATLARFPRLLDDLGATFEPASTVYDAAEKFVVSCYSPKTDPIPVNTHRYAEFSRTQKKSLNLPPCLTTLKHHIDRANYQAAIWRRSMEAVSEIPSPVGKGWDQDMMPVLTDSDPAPKQLLGLQICKCKKGCRARCSCKKHKLACTAACGCGPDTCSNVADSDSDTEEPI